MADNFRYRYGDAKPVVSPPVVSATVVEIGDLVTNTPAPASAVAWASSIAGTQEAFHDVFLGVAAQRSRNGDTDSVRVNTTGVHEFDCQSATFALGALVGPAKQAGNAIESQKVVAVATPNLAVGRIAKAYPTATTKVLVEIDSTLMNGGPQAPA